jgi:hypothetical protein
MSEEFKNQLLVHARTVVDRAGRAQSEEATKQFLIIPFLQLLGYDPLNPDEIIPEADASFSDKFKNRVDYAIAKEGVPVIAIETKKVGSLSSANRGELKGYYNAVPTVKLVILTDGLVYQLYSDTDQENLMDDEPFAVVDLTQLAQEQIAHEALDALLKLRRGTFNPVAIGADFKDFRGAFAVCYKQLPRRCSRCHHVSRRTAPGCPRLAPPRRTPRPYPLRPSPLQATPSRQRRASGESRGPPCK